MSIQLIALGGFAEVGRNCLAIDINGKIIICDMGLHLEKYLEAGEENVFKQKHVIRKLMSRGALPDINLLGKRRRDVVAIICTHAHVDHIGAVPFLSKRFDCPVYTTPFTGAVLASLCAGQHVTCDVRNYPVDASFTVGGIRVDFIPVAHSTPQTVNLAIHTDEGVIIYGNDYKEDTAFGETTDLTIFSRYAGKTKLLILDALYAPSDTKAPSELDARKQVLALETRLKGYRTIVASTFSSHIYRLISLCDLADRLGRKVVFIGRSLARYLDAAKQVGIADLSLRGEIISYGGHARKFLSRINDPKKYFIITTGHQGEPDAMLTRMLEGLYEFTTDDVIIFSSRVIPSEVTQQNSAALQQKIDAQGVPYIRDVHVSGHGAGKDHLKLLELLKPEYCLPSHALPEMMMAFRKRALEHGYTDKDILLLETGRRLRL